MECQIYLNRKKSGERSVPFKGAPAVCVMGEARPPLTWLSLLTDLFEPSWRHLLATIGTACEQLQRENMGGNEIVFGDEAVSS